MLLVHEELNCTHVRYARLTESRSTTPSPPPSTTSPLRIRLPRFPFGSRDDTSSEPSTSADSQVTTVINVNSCPIFRMLFHRLRTKLLQ